jgi:hypothetical protein
MSAAPIDRVTKGNIELLRTGIDMSQSIVLSELEKKDPKLYKLVADIFLGYLVLREYWEGKIVSNDFIQEKILAMDEKIKMLEMKK